ncbi:hypothetical protein CARN8_160002 [mine drainage metagenome]|uniref:Uncharacterized protein n=1 Tax=mine drainage metagenome TaxID=410659 RepID=A0A3P3ZLX6_9ZZZZ
MAYKSAFYARQVAKLICRNLYAELFGVPGYTEKYLNQLRRFIHNEIDAINLLLCFLWIFAHQPVSDNGN